VLVVVVVLQPAFAAAVPAHEITDLPLGSTEIVVDVPEVVGSTETTCWAAIAVAELRPDAAITVTEVTLRANGKKLTATIGKTVSSISKPVRRLKDIATQGSSAATYSEQRLLDTEVAENIAYAIVEFRPCDLDPGLAVGGTLPLTFEATVVEGGESRVIVEQRLMLIQANQRVSTVGSGETDTSTPTGPMPGHGSPRSGRPRQPISCNSIGSHSLTDSPRP
jgi:hypothetical protein